MVCTEEKANFTGTYCEVHNWNTHKLQWQWKDRHMQSTCPVVNYTKMAATPTLRRSQVCPLRANIKRILHASRLPWSLGRIAGGPGAGGKEGAKEATGRRTSWQQDGHKARLWWVFQACTGFFERHRSGQQCVTNTRNRSITSTTSPSRCMFNIMSSCSSPGGPDKPPDV